MIFVTVGACDLPFNRLINAVSHLANLNGSHERIFAQIGHSSEPKRPVEFERFLPLQKMHEYADEARMIISQGGPGSIMLALARGKIPIVVPRQQVFGEMVDDHQVLFANKLAAEGKIVLVMDTANLSDAIANYDTKTAGLNINAGNVKQKAATFAARVEQAILDHQKTKAALRHSFE